MAKRVPTATPCKTVFPALARVIFSRSLNFFPVGRRIERTGWMRPIDAPATRHGSCSVIDARLAEVRRSASHYEGRSLMQVRRIVNMLAVATIVVGTTTACATKKFVRNEVDAVGTRVETLSQSLEATQEADASRTRRASRRSMRRPIRSASGRRKPRRPPRTANSAAAAASRADRRRRSLDEAARV